MNIAGLRISLSFIGIDNYATCTLGTIKCHFEIDIWLKFRLDTDSRKVRVGLQNDGNSPNVPRKFPERKKQDISGNLGILGKLPSFSNPGFAS